MASATALAALTPYYLKGIVNTFTSESPDVELAKVLFFKMFLVYVGINISYRIFDVAISVHESCAMKDLDLRSFRKLQQLSMRFFENSYSGSLVTRVRRFRAAYESISDLFFFQFGKNMIMFFAIAFVFVRNMPALAVPFIVWSLIFVTYCIVTSVLKFPVDTKSAELDSAVGAALADSLTNHLAVKTFGQERAEEARFGKVVERSHKARLRSWLLSALIMVGQWILMGAAELLFIWWMIDGWQRGAVTAADFVFAQSFVFWATANLVGFGHSIRKFLSSLADAKEMADVHEQTPEVIDAPGARTLTVEEGEVEFDSVNFSYDGSAKHLVIKDFSLTIEPGTSIGLVGRSGSGKSTLVKTLFRFYDLYSGRIRIDRQDIANVTQASLRQQLAIVPQQPHLFHRSVRDNIAFASPDATEAEIIEAARQAHALEFIKALPNGFDTLIGERGNKISGGEQQRIAIARAILANPQILILDEATSALDSATEKHIQKAIENLLRNRTAIVIAHRLSTIMQLDEIVVMENGCIIERGSHKDLLDLNGAYAELWSHQSGGYIS